MIRSMTGFGRAETNEDGKKITVEAQRTINGLSLERIDSTTKKRRS